MSDLRVLLSGLLMTEAPRWHADRLWFSDWIARELIAVDLAGNKQIVARPPSMPFCFDWTLDGQLLIVSGGEGLLLRQKPDGTTEAWADLRMLSSHPWNEIVVDGRGNAYVNGIGFDFPGGEFAPGQIALVTPDGAIRQVAGDVAFPNGMVVTPDNATLILAESYANQLTAFDIAADGSLTNRRVWAALGGAYPDGICLDAENAVWYADVPNKRCVRVREGGEVLQTIELDRGAFACMLGGVDGRTLFVTANDWGGPQGMGAGATGQVLAADVAVPRAGWP